ncbi:SpoIIE family protein phosphatase [Duganella sp. sic0402]|uniref:PP2C family protein-serine/threonine phosphatase n=1 Tax=Duganella sp. sic0402 TaxID=2854786 RepID=UPI001C474871|nr:SpoIIE family protein phosphatase [Duganella sp. sic0402]MBV7538306.1 SpoIIE family protein phosphatase [Duganella sp. sic0402]
MNNSAITRRPFRRSGERRHGLDHLLGHRHDHRHEERDVERRRQGMDWIGLFRQASADAVDAALAEAEVLNLPAGAPLLNYGEVNHSVYILLSGLLHVHLDGKAGSSGAIAVSPGELIGELSAIDGEPVSALVVAHEPSQVLQLSRDLFWQKLMALPGVASNLMTTLTGRMRRSNEAALKAQRSALELEHLRKELDIARQLQVSMLPLQRPLFPERSDLHACGLMEPASHVGGDLFDAFFIDDHLLFICIGDVSGHGVAAALFMARAIGLLRVLAMSITEPDQLLATLNDRLCAGNDTNLFVTLFCGFLEVDTGLLRYSNGGHCPPMLLSGGIASLLPIPKGVLVGAFPGLIFGAMQTVLAPGDTLLCYTDGVTEAANEDGVEFSEERCLELLAQWDHPSLPEALDLLRLAVSTYTGQPVLDDDCTMLAIRRPLASGLI